MDATTLGTHASTGGFKTGEPGGAGGDAADVETASSDIENSAEAYGGIGGDGGSGVSSSRDASPLSALTAGGSSTLNLSVTLSETVDHSNGGFVTSLILGDPTPDGTTAAATGSPSPGDAFEGAAALGAFTSPDGLLAAPVGAAGHGWSTRYPPAQQPSPGTMAETDSAILARRRTCWRWRPRRSEPARAVERGSGAKSPAPWMA